LVEYFARGADLHHSPLVQDDDTIRRHHGLRLIVRHIDRRNAKFFVQPADLEAHLLAQIRIQIAQRLVQ
jgi:hypothetical protein